MALRVYPEMGWIDFSCKLGKEALNVFGKIMAQKYGYQVLLSQKLVGVPWLDLRLSGMEMTLMIAGPSEILSSDLLQEALGSINFWSQILVCLPFWLWLWNNLVEVTHA